MQTQTPIPVPNDRALNDHLYTLLQDADYSVANDGIGWTEAWGVPHYHKGSDYVEEVIYPDELRFVIQAPTRDTDGEVALYGIEESFRFTYGEPETPWEFSVECEVIEERADGSAVVLAIIEGKAV